MSFSASAGAASRDIRCQRGLIWPIGVKRHKRDACDLAHEGFVGGWASAPDGERDARSLKRRWITLISAGWLPHYIGPSRGCLALVSGIITADAHIGLSRVPLTVSARRVADPV